MADGLRSVPLLTVAAPHLPWPYIGVPALGDRDLGARGRKGTRGPHWGPGPPGWLVVPGRARPVPAGKGAVGGPGGERVAASPWTPFS